MKTKQVNFRSAGTYSYFLCLALILVLISYQAEARNFYFSNSIGDDSRSVTQAQNPATPWKTLNKLNTFFSSLLAGDSVLFRRGEVFDGKIIVSKSGSSTLPIILGAYGTGNKPVINGFITLSNWTSLGGGIWQSAAPACKASVNMVTLNGVQQAIGRYPNTGYLTFESASGTTSITDNELTNNPNWTGAEVVIRKRHWIIDRNPITDHTNSTITYTSGSSFTGLSGYGYFIQKDVKTLDSFGEWYFDFSTKNLKMFFGTANPDGYVIKASIVDTLVFVNTRSYITFDNLSFQGANVAAFYIYNSPSIIIRNCEIDFSGTDAIKGLSNSSYCIIESTTINHSNNNAIFLDYGCNSASIRYNTIKNTGIISGMGQSGSDSYQGILTKGINSLIESNSIDSSGYIGIYPLGNYAQVKKNLINYYCSIKDDGAGIYTYGNTLGKTISNNIILNGIGAGAGTVDNKFSSHGIYMDGESSNIDVRYNTIAHTSLNGIYLHNSHEINVHDNTVYNNGVQLIMVHDNGSPNSPTRNVTLDNNIFFSKTSLQKTLSMTSTENDISLFGTADSNYYVRPFGDEAVATLYYWDSGKEFNDALSFSGWYDSLGRQSPVNIPDYTLINLIGSNKFPNGTFNSNISGTSLGWYTGTAAVSWDNTNKINGGSCKTNVSALSTGWNQVYTETSVGPINSIKKYILKFSCLGTKSNKMIGIYLRISSAPWTKITPTLYFPITTTRKDYELLLSPTGNDANAVLSFVFSDVDCPSYIDNIEFYEANLTVTNPDDYILFDYNATNVNKTVPLNGTYIDVDSTVHTNSITLLPYTSVVLIKSSDTSSNLPPTLLNQSFQLNENSPNGTAVGTVLATDPNTGQTLTYTILSGNTNSAFAINASTGAITVANSAALNYETTPSFALVVKVLDNGTPSLSSQATVTVNLLNVNEAPIIANQTFSTNENSANGTVVGTVVATDPDAGQTLSYSILSGNTNNAFVINSITGVITVANSTVLNFETTASFALVVKVQDNGTPSLSSQATVTVNLININEPPIIANQTFSINENSANGTVVGTVAATDPDVGQILTYSILSGNTNGAFVINASTGVLTVANTIALNFETTPSFALVVKVQDNGAPSLSSQATVTVNLINVNEPPIIANQTFSINENSANGTVVGTVAATDPDVGQILTYSILSGNTNGAFAINASTGVLTVANTIALNFETTPSFALVVKVQDNGIPSLSSQATVTVNLINVNEPPVLNNQSFSVAQFAPYGTLVGTVVATDPDAGQTLTFSIISGNTSSAFSINPSSGAITVANSTALNFQVNPLFNLVVRVTDNGTGNLFDDATITINVVQSSNQPPVIANQSFSINENSANGTVVGTVAATDPDVGQVLNYSIFSGNTNGAFVINASTGVLTVANTIALNFETTPSFALVVKVQDNGTPSLSSQATVTVNLINVNESPIIVNQTFSINENSANGTVVGTVAATDPDVGQVLTYSILSGNTNGAFVINASTGVLTVTNTIALNFETTPSFTLIVKVQDNGTPSLSSQATVTVNLINVNESPIIVNQTFSINENSANGTVVGTVAASDPDVGQVLTYFILSGNTNGAFVINASTGVLTVANTIALNFETTPSFALVVKVQDNGTPSLSSQATVTVNLINVNESPIIVNQTFSINENSANGTVVGTVAATDPDVGQILTYSILSGNTNGAFVINALTGVLTVANTIALNFETTPSFALVVKVQDNGTPSLSSQATVTVNLINVNESPIIVNQTFSINENSANGTVVGTVAASDPDVGQVLTYFILSGNTNGAFVINASTGVLTVANTIALNFETTPSFALVVKVQDNGTPSLSSQATVTVNLINVNESPIIVNQTFSINENSANGTVVGTVAATDPDVGQILTYSILSGNTNGAFVINALTGVLTVANTIALNFETTPSFALVVKVQDNGTPSLNSQATVTVNLINMNEPPIITNQTFSIYENSANGSLVGTVAATDPDVGQVLTYSILSGNTNGAFVINALTGVLTVANTIALNFETIPSFALAVKVQDNGTPSLSSQAIVMVNLNDINEPPFIANQAFSIAEYTANGTSVGTVVASDPDAGQTLTFSIISGNTSSAFSINPSSGAITVANSTALNFQVNPLFNLVVRVTDNGTGNLFDDATITINVLQSSNQPPVIANQSFSINENSANGTVVGTVAANDPDVGQVLTYSILSGNTNGAFVINASTGVLTVANTIALNFETTPSFVLVVKVQDNGIPSLSSQATIIVNLIDINEPPIITNQTFSINENSANGTVVGTVVASDPDAGQTLVYSIFSGNINGAFAIFANTGKIIVANSAVLDFESIPSIYLQIKVTDNGTGNLSNQASVTVNLIDVNEAPIIGNQTFATNENSANGTIVGTVIASDPDAGQTLTYKILSGNTNNAFALNFSTGIITVANSNALNYETTPTFTLVVKVQDNGIGSLSSQALITINLLNLNEPPVINNQLFAIPEHASNGTIIGTIVAFDPDEGQSLQYLILSGNPSGTFALNPNTGVLLVADSTLLSYVTNPEFSLVVIVQDNGTPSLSNQATMTIYLEEVFDYLIINNPDSTGNKFILPEVVTPMNLNINQIQSKGIKTNYSSSIFAQYASNVALMYPNPTSGLLNIELNKGISEEFDLTICDLAGKTHFQCHYKHDNKITLDLDKYPRGIYLLSIRSKDFQSSYRFIIK